MFSLPWGSQRRENFGLSRDGRCAQPTMSDEGRFPMACALYLSLERGWFLVAVRDPCVVILAGTDPAPAS